MPGAYSPRLTLIVTLPYGVVACSPVRGVRTKCMSYISANVTLSTENTVRLSLEKSFLTLLAKVTVTISSELVGLYNGAAAIGSLAKKIT